MVEVLVAQGLSEKEAYERIALYYQMLAEGCSRVEARRALRSDAALSYLNTLVSAAIRGIIDKGFQPEEVEDAINLYYHPCTPRIPYEFNDPNTQCKLSDYPLDQTLTSGEMDEINDELIDLIREDRAQDE